MTATQATRPITFPRTADGFWMNRETGVHVVNLAGIGRNEYEVRRPAANVVGWQHAAYRRTLAEARSAAKETAEKIRKQIAEAYVEAVIEHIDRSETEAKKVGASTWRHEAARHGVDSERFESALYDVQRADETTDARRRRYAEAYEEARREEANRQMDAFCERHGYRGSRTPGAIRRLVEDDHAEALQADRDIRRDAYGYERGSDVTIVAINADDGWYGNAVRAELQLREERRERGYAVGPAV